MKPTGLPEHTDVYCPEEEDGSPLVRMGKKLVEGVCGIDMTIVNADSWSWIPALTYFSIYGLYCGKDDGKGPVPVPPLKPSMRDHPWGWAFHGLPVNAEEAFGYTEVILIRLHYLDTVI